MSIMNTAELVTLARKEERERIKQIVMDGLVDANRDVGQFAEGYRSACRTILKRIGEP